jgi:2-methylcitrate dehydratase PrpD
MSKHLHAGRAAESGLLAAELARLGFTGPPAILEGDKGFFAGACPDAKPTLVLLEPAAPWQLVQTSIKPWPSCRHTHPSIDAALELHRQLRGRAITDINADVYQAALDVCDRSHPQSEYEAKFSLSHCIAAALADGHVALDSFDSDSRRRLAPLGSRVSAVVTEPYRSAYPDRYWGARISVKVSDGETLIVEKKGCKGDPEFALSRQEMLDKAKMLMQHGGLEQDAVDALVHSILDLATGRANWEILGHVIPEGARA